MKFEIPKNVTRVTETLTNAGFEAFLVGGCVRDLLMGKSPKDFDVTTNAKPDEIVKLFESEENPLKVVYENMFGTVAIIFEEEELSSHVRQIEITPYRRETTYSDFRHPDEVQFAEKLEDDLMRRDFTMNALAYGKPQEPTTKNQTNTDVSHDGLALGNLDLGSSEAQIIDLYEGIKDIERRIIRTVGNPDERFGEDALRMLRAVRFAAQLNFGIEGNTLDAIARNKDLLKNVSQERIRDEFVKIVASKTPAIGIGLMKQLGILELIIPELLEGVGCEQGGVHIYDVFTHLVMACQHAADKEFPFYVRLAALFHDIGKPRTRRPGHRKAYTFYGHEVVGAKMTKKIMERLKFPNADIEIVTKFVRWHMFFSDTEQITLSAVRRMIQNVGGAKPPLLEGEPREASGGVSDTNQNSTHPLTPSRRGGTEHPIWTLMQVRECDRVGMNKTEAPYRLRKYFAMIEQCLRDPISVSQLAIDGNYLMRELGVKPGPRMGWMLHAMLDEVLENPELNTIENLSNRVKELEQLPDGELKKLGEAGKERKEEVEEEEIAKLNQKHRVK